jgi:transcription termination factor NusB
VGARTKSRKRALDILFEAESPAFVNGLLARIAEVKHTLG